MIDDYETSLPQLMLLDWSFTELARGGEVVFFVCAIVVAVCQCLLWWWWCGGGMVWWGGVGAPSFLLLAFGSFGVVIVAFSTLSYLLRK